MALIVPETLRSNRFLPHKTLGWLPTPASAAYDKSENELSALIGAVLHQVSVDVHILELDDT